MADYNLRVFAPILIGANDYIGDITDIANGWRRTIRWNGGPWQGSFTLVGPLPDLQWWFYNLLGCHVEERSAGLNTWTGLVYEMDLTVEGCTRRRSLDLLANAVKSRYVTFVDDQSQVVESAWATNDESIARYGRKEEVLSLDGYTEAAALARRDTTLAEFGVPWPRTISLQRGYSPLSQQTGGAAILQVIVCGYIFTTNWKYVTTADDSTGNVSDWIGQVASTDMQLVTPGDLRTNTLQVRRKLTMPQRAYDLVKELAEMGGADGLPWRFAVDASRLAHYQPMDPAPRYRWKQGGLYDAIGSPLEVNGWTVQPGVVRDELYPVAAAMGGDPLLQDPRDTFITEVEMGEGGLQLKTELFSESDILAAQQEYERNQGGE